MLRIFSFLFLVSCLHLKAQTIFSGKVIDPLTKESLAYVNIGIKNKNVGTTSLADGSFSLIIPASFGDDSLTFSLVGYVELKVPIKNAGPKLIPLFRKGAQLNEVVISTSRLTEKKFGVKKRNPAIHFIDGSINADDIFEIAQLTRLPNERCRVSSLDLFINESTEDSVVCRVNFYTYENLRPARQLNEKSFLFNTILKEGWMHFDISRFNFQAQGDLIAAVEILPSAKRKKRVLLEVKLGGGSKSFFRKNSQGEWSRSPHHYLMHINAFVPSTAKIKAEDEKETVATKRIFSQNVQDSFSLFIRLPNSYSEYKFTQYPIIFLLDANVYFDLVSDYWNPESKMYLSEAILVGIGYNDAFQMDSLRQRDYTFPKPLSSDSCTICGGADRFRDFIQKELIPFMAKNYRTKLENVSLMGHSLGGYFPAWCLLMDLKENNSQIKNYVALSPSLEYADNFLTKELKKMKSESKTTPKKLYINFGEKEMDLTTKKNCTELSGMTTALVTGHYTTLTFEILQGFDHMETALPGFASGLRMALKNQR